MVSTVAVVLCNYNHAGYLPDSLGHICAQTRAADQILVVDDGSTDDSWHIIQKFAGEHSNLQALANDRNLGLEASIARALSLVCCDYLVWAGADDRLLPLFLERNMGILARHPHAALSFSEVVVLKGDGEEIDRFATNPAAPRIFDLSDLPPYLPPDQLRQRMKRGYLPIASNTAVIRVDLLKEFGGFPAALRWFADSFACTALAMRYGACVIAEPLALIRSRPGSYSQTMRDAPQQTKVLDALLELLAQPQLRDIRAFVKDCPSNLAIYDPLILNVLSKRPGDWDLFAAYAQWKMREYGVRTWQRTVPLRLVGLLWNMARKRLTTSAAIAQRSQAICEAAGRGDLVSLRRLHQNGAHLHADDDEPLCRACQGGQLDVVRYLHQNGVALEARDNEPLCRACQGGQLDVVRYLHQNGVALEARDNEPLCRACQGGHLDVVRYLHQNGVALDVRNGEPLRRAAADGHLEVVRYLHHGGAATQLLTSEARQSIEQMREEMSTAPTVDQPSRFWTKMGEINERVLDWSGEANFKRTLNQNYFNFIPTAPDDARMLRMRRLARHLGQSMHAKYVIEDPDCDPTSWISWYPGYYIFKEPDRATKCELYREYLALMYEYALQRDHSGLLATLEEPTLGNPIRVQRNGRLVSQDIVNSVRERNSILAAMDASSDTRFMLAELGAGYGRLGYVMLKTTGCRYFVFDIPPALYLSQWYLTALFPGRRAFKFRRFGAFEEIESELSGAEIAFFTPNQLAKFPSAYFDVFATISSVHEMRRDQISYYMTLMGRTTKSALYLKQQKDYVNPVDNLMIGKDDYPLPVGWSPKHERFDLINPGFFERVYRR
jgi:putative sugar O-methyltransferase